jgi:hypothetical protein
MRSSTQSSGTSHLLVQFVATITGLKPAWTPYLYTVPLGILYALITVSVTGLLYTPHAGSGSVSRQLSCVNSAFGALSEFKNESWNRTSGSESGWSNPEISENLIIRPHSGNRRTRSVIVAKLQSLHILQMSPGDTYRTGTVDPPNSPTPPTNRPPLILQHGPQC